MLLGLEQMRDRSTPLASLITSYELARTDWSDAHRKWTLNYLREFDSFVKEQGRSATINDLDVMVASAYVTEKKLVSLHSGRAAAVTVRGLGAFAEECGIFEVNPLRKLRVPKPPEDVRQPLRDDQVKRLLEFAGDCPRPAQAARDVAIISLLLETAIRFNEIRLIELEDLDWQDRVITVRAVTTKGKRKSRQITLGVNAARRLDNYISDYRQNVGWPQVFLTLDGDPLAEGGLDSIFDRMSERSGVKFSAHILRHTALTNDARNGKDVIAIGHKAGWTTKSTVKMAERYTGQRDFLENRMSSLDRVLARRAS